MPTSDLKTSGPGRAREDMPGRLPAIVVHDNNFIFSDHLSRTVCRSPGEIPGNGIDDDENGYVDDVHGYHFDRDSAELYTTPFSGDPKDRRTLHGTSCATIASGAGGPEGVDHETGHGLINCHAAVKEVLRRKELR